jgi:hypothetical protein
MNEVMANQRKQATKRANGGVAPTPKQHYLDCLQLSPGLIELLGDAKIVEDGPYPVVQSASDFSYNAPTYSGDHYRLVGDAAGECTPNVHRFTFSLILHSTFYLLAFIDPFFSSGVHMAFTGGLAAAVTVASSIRGEHSETEVCKYHDAKIAVAYTRYVFRIHLYKQLLRIFLKVPRRRPECIQANAGTRPFRSHGFGRGWL